MAQYNSDSYFGTEERPLSTPTSDEKTIAILCHILTIVPGIGILAPLIIYLVKGGSSEFVNHHSRESLNFQITIFLLYILSIFLVILLIGFLLIWLVGIINTILVIVATIKTSENKLYRYPFSIRLV